MIWRDYKIDPGVTDKSARKAAMKDLIASGRPVGLIGSINGATVAWCSIAPRTTYKGSLGGFVGGAGDDQAIWSLTCFFVKRELHGLGISAQLLNAAMDHAAANGATVIEAYPVDPTSPSYRFCGFITLFEDHGFKKVGTIGKRRYIFRKSLEASA
jgi:GNAT superfamily N-acetyltransferase